MSERGAFRENRSARGGPTRGTHPHRGARGGGGGRGGSSSAHNNNNEDAKERPKKENILDLSKYMDKEISVKFNGGREVTGLLKGFDPLMNLVLDDVKEITRDENGNTNSRTLGLVVARGTLLTVISPVDGSEEIMNPYAEEEEEEEE